jgi:hypothetical protein
MINDLGRDATKEELRQLHELCERVLNSREKISRSLTQMIKNTNLEEHERDALRYLTNVFQREVGKVFDPIAIGTEFVDVVYSKRIAENLLRIVEDYNASATSAMAAERSPSKNKNIFI